MYCAASGAGIALLLYPGQECPSRAKGGGGAANGFEVDWGGGVEWSGVGWIEV